MVEMAFRGATTAEIGEATGLQAPQVGRELRAAVRAGIVEEVRDKLLAQVEATPGIYQAILAATPEELSKHARGYKLKLDAANALNTGAGTFRAESHKTTEEKWTLETIAKEKAAGSAVTVDAQTPRIRFLPEATAGTDAPSPSPAPTATPAPSVVIVAPV